MNLETISAIMIVLTLPLLIIILNKIKLMHLEEEMKTKQSFKQRDWMLNRNRRCKKGTKDDTKRDDN